MLDHVPVQALGKEQSHEEADKADVQKHDQRPVGHRVADEKFFIVRLKLVYERFCQLTKVSLKVGQI